MELVYFEVYAWCKILVIPDLIRPIIDVLMKLYNYDALKIIEYVKNICVNRLQLLYNESININLLYYPFAAHVSRDLLIRRINNKIVIWLTIDFNNSALKYNYDQGEDYPLHFKVIEYIENIYKYNKQFELQIRSNLDL